MSLQTYAMHAAYYTAPILKVVETSYKINFSGTMAAGYYMLLALPQPSLGVQTQALALGSAKTIAMQSEK